MKKAIQFILFMFIFIFPLFALASSGIFINEVAWMGTTASINDEWIELWNNSSVEVDLSGWRLVASDGQPEISLTGIILPDDYFLLERTDDESVPNKTANQIYSGILGNTGEALSLFDSSNSLVDSFDMSTGWLFGDNITKQTMARGDSLAWITSTEVGGTPKAKNLILSLIPEGDQTASSSLPIISSSTEEVYQLGSVLINEFVSDPTDSDVEWIELFNNLGKEISLDNWKIIDGSGAETSITGKISNKGFFVIEKPKGSLNNAGDQIFLRDAKGNLIDQVSYGDWDDGKKEDNASVASDPKSIARKIDGANSFSNVNDFAVTLTLTKGKSNIIFIEQAGVYGSSNFICNQQVVVSEIFPDPIGSDSEKEFVEIYNSSGDYVDLSGWKISDSSNFGYTLSAADYKDLVLGPKEYFIIYRTKSKIALNNNADEINLYCPLQDELLRTVEYKKAEEGASFNLTDDGRFQWSDAITPGEENIIKENNFTVEVDFTFPDNIFALTPVLFDSSDTTEISSGSLEFKWDFGDGIELCLPSPTHTYLRPGNYNVVLEVDDGKTKIKKEKIVKVLPAEYLSLNSTSVASDSVKIISFFPNPDGADAEEEWIKIKNVSLVPVNLVGWKIDDGAGGSRPFTIAKDFWLAGGEEYTFNREETSLALNNTSDSVRLINNLDIVMEEVKYDKAVVDAIYEKDKHNNWSWISELGNIEKKVSSSAVKISSSIKKSSSATANINLEDVYNLQSGDKITVQGTVAVLPGVFSGQYFYIVNNLAGLQVYSNKKDYPSLKVGDLVKVRGELSLVNGEKRLKTKTQADIIILKNETEPVPALITSDSIDDMSTGRLVKIQGIVGDKKSGFLLVDDGTDLLNIIIKDMTEIDLASTTEGDKISIAGILNMTKSGVRLLPRFASDLEILVSKNSNPAVLGESAQSEELKVPERNQSEWVKNYLIIGSMLVVGGATTFYVKRKK